LLVDTVGNLYTATSPFGSGNAGTVVKLSPSNGSWAFNLLASFSSARTSTQGGPTENLVMDQAGNIYGTTTSAVAYGYGSVFKLTRSGNNWIYTSLYDFRGDNNGFNPISNIVFDVSGNLSVRRSTAAPPERVSSGRSSRNRPSHQHPPADIPIQGCRPFYSEHR
jgi:hypothetical protein